MTLTETRSIHPRVLVLGDLTLNVANRPATAQSRKAGANSERPRPNCELELGGAAKACRLLRVRKFEVTCAGYIGHDDFGRTLQRMLDVIGVNRDLVFVNFHRPTTVVERSVASSHTEGLFPAPCEDQLLLGLCGSIQHHQAMVVSDSGHGLCTPRLLRAAIRVARHVGISVLVDPLCHRAKQVAQAIDEVAALRADEWNLQRWLAGEGSQSRAA